MYFVGIDISKFKHDCAIIDELCDTVMPSWSFSMTGRAFRISGAAGQSGRGKEDRA